MVAETKLTRRTMMAAGAALPLAAGLMASKANAGGHAAPPNSNKHSFAVGDFQVSTLLGGTRTVDSDPQGIFGMNVSKEEFAAVSAENFIPADKAQFFFTPTVINTGSEVVLFDAGPSAAATAAALGSAGLTPEDVDIVVLTHMHGDHIGGLTQDDGSLSYPNARYIANQAEYDHWAAAGNDNFEAKVRPITEQISFIGDGASVASGITGLAAFGHTPGHMVYMIESGGEQLMILADLANHYVWSLAYPDWEVRFDMDKEAAATT
ncbi:MAG: MBL fold metallo-hydrolase, partial [Pseudomonadota bacterium]